MSRKQLWILIGAVLIVDALTLPFIIMYVLRQQPAKGEAGSSIAQADTLPALYPVPDFTFTAQDGSEFHKPQLDGKIWIADVFFTSCGGPCPVMSASLAGVAGNYEPDSGVRFVSFTVDPKTDTPAVLNEYAKRYRADFNEWTFLTGAPEKLQDFAKNGLKVGSGDTALIHSEYFVLVDRKGMIRGYYIGTDPEEVAKLKVAIERLRKEAA